MAVYANTNTHNLIKILKMDYDLNSYQLQLYYSVIQQKVTILISEFTHAEKYDSQLLYCFRKMRFLR